MSNPEPQLPVPDHHAERSAPTPPPLLPVLTPEVMPPPTAASAPSAPGIGRKRLMLAFAIAIVSDGLSVGTNFIPPIQWGIDVVTALLLFAVLGWNWILLPALIAEAIPGLAMFPVWVLVVASVAAFGAIKRPGLPGK